MNRDMDEQALDAATILATMLKLRGQLTAYRGKYGQFHSVAFDGQPNVPNPQLLTNCRVLHDRMEIIRHLRPGGRFAEVGTFKGDFIVKAMDVYEPTEIHLFDMSFDNILDENKKILDSVGCVTYHAGDSSSLLMGMPDAYFDVIYVDADHSYRGVWKDLEAAHLKVKPDGYIVCNDYTNFDPIQMLPYGVYSAVNRFATEFGYRFDYLALGAWGFHDVALRRW